ncbi:MAG: helix-hairpin-helix domain-containing protein [Planctomycetia bacterium]|nr:helix-hairpin-helix domain-containing protein [Planctomycetia bacterium]
MVGEVAVPHELAEARAAGCVENQGFGVAHAGCATEVPSEAIAYSIRERLSRSGPTMHADTPEPSLLPRRTQPTIVAAVCIALAAMAVWYVGQGGLSGGLVHHDAAPATAGGFTVNINQAGVNELAQLPELGMATAQRIVDHRREHGPFASLDALLDVPGIGPATLDAMRPHLRPIRPRTTSP